MLPASSLCCFSSDQGIWVGRVTEDTLDTDWLTADKRKQGNDLVVRSGGKSFRMNLVNAGTEFERSPTPTEEGSVLFVIPGLTIGMNDSVYFPEELWTAVEAAHKETSPVSQTIGSDAVTVHVYGSKSKDTICTVCFKEGDLAVCAHCPRAYHLKCLPAGVRVDGAKFDCTQLGNECTKRKKPIHEGTDSQPAVFRPCVSDLSTVSVPEEKPKRGSGRSKKTSKQARRRTAEPDHIDIEGTPPPAKKKKVTTKRKKSKTSTKASDDALLMSGQSVCANFFKTTNFPGGSSSSKSRTVASAGNAKELLSKALASSLVPAEPTSLETTSPFTGVKSHSLTHTRSRVNTVNISPSTPTSSTPLSVSLVKASTKNGKKLTVRRGLVLRKGEVIGIVASVHRNPPPRMSLSLSLSLSRSLARSLARSVCVLTLGTNVFCAEVSIRDTIMTRLNALCQSHNLLPTSVDEKRLLQSFVNDCKCFRFILHAYLLCSFVRSSMVI
jgi:hypothetical protein